MLQIGGAGSCSLEMRLSLGCRINHQSLDGGGGDHYPSQTSKQAQFQRIISHQPEFPSTSLWPGSMMNSLVSTNLILVANGPPGFLPSSRGKFPVLIAFRLVAHESVCTSFFTPTRCIRISLFFSPSSREVAAKTKSNPVQQAYNNLHMNNLQKYHALAPLALPMAAACGDTYLLPRTRRGDFLRNWPPKRHNLTASSPQHISNRRVVPAVSGC